MYLKEFVRIKIVAWIFTTLSFKGYPNRRILHSPWKYLALGLERVSATALMLHS